MRHHGVDIALGKAGQGEAIGHKARDHGRQHDVRRAKGPEQIGPLLSKAGAGLRPVLQDADRIGAGLGGDGDIFKFLARVHRAFAAERHVAAVHFGTERPRHAARDIVLGPIPVAAHLVRQIIDNCQTVPNDGIVIPQDRNLARRWCQIVFALALFPIVIEQRDHNFVKMKTGLLDRQPTAERPARIDFVAGDQFQRHDATASNTASRKSSIPPFFSAEVTEMSG